MLRTLGDFDRLIAELRLDSTRLSEAGEKNARAAGRILSGSTDELDLMALGYTIHNVYGIIENACLRISKFFENDLPREGWHAELLRRMTLDIPRIRPALLTRDEYLRLDELRAFRHLFRNLYDRPLDADKVNTLQRKVPDAVETFRRATERYVGFLERLRDSVGP